MSQERATLFMVSPVQQEEKEKAQTKRDEFTAYIFPNLRMLYSRALKYTNNPQDAEDLVAQTCERAYRAFDSFQRGTNVAAWLTTILKNTYFNEYKKKKRRPQRANAETGEYNDWDIYSVAQHSPEDIQSAEEEYLRDDISAEVIRALSRLSPERRRVFIEIALQGKSYKQFAAENNLKIGTVMSRLNRARAQLKESLKQYCTK